MIAYHGNPDIKTALLSQLQIHHDLDQIEQGLTWEHGKGCAVGCTLHGYNHAEYETRFGIPESLAHLEDAIFEGLSPGDAKRWPIDFVKAIPVGADLSRIQWQFLAWLLTDEGVNPGITHPSVASAVKAVADLCERAARGDMPSPVEWESAAEEAWSAWSAAWLAADSERSAGSAAHSAAQSVEWSARSAEWSASLASLADSERSAGSAAWSAARSAAAWSARAESAAWSAWRLQAAKLLALLSAARPSADATDMLDAG